MLLPLYLTGDAGKATPLQYDGVRPYIKQEGHLDHLSPKRVTNAIGDDYDQQLDLSTLLEDTPEAKATLRDMAIRIAERGVCFFRNQSITWDQQKELVVRMAHATGSPLDSNEHRQPVSQMDGGKKLTVSSQAVETFGKEFFPNLFTNHYWHTDGTFENVDSAYSCLKIIAAPDGGGDTLWCSLYDCVDKLSPGMIKYLETLNAEHDSEFVLKYADKSKPIVTNRGSPENNDPTLHATHPVIATHPVTGWKRLGVNRLYTKHIIGLTKQESDLLLEYLYKIISDNHDIQVRYRWENNSVALWDNRSTAHCVTNDYVGQTRYGERAIGVGEKSVVDQHSLTKKEALAQAKAATTTNGVNGHDVNPAR